MNVSIPSPSPVAVIGAGPVGLAAAAHLVRRGRPVVVLEAGASVASHLASYRQVRLFSPWRYNIDRAVRALLDAAGWVAPDADVQLELPQTGVCSVDLAGPSSKDDGAACCGGPAKADSSACCALDESSKAGGKSGCGCGTNEASSSATPLPQGTRSTAKASAACCG